MLVDVVVVVFVGIISTLSLPLSAPLHPSVRERRR
jgi:hypothetical protein